MAETTCKIDGCERDQRVRGWCSAHWKRVQRNGNPGPAAIRRRGVDPGCSVPDCERGHFGKGYCQTHLYRFRANGDPLVTRSNAPVAGPENPSWRGDDVSYAAVHRRLRVYRGPARLQPCIECGHTANGWAYQHNAVDEKICAKVSLPFTTDLACYEPMCWQCHAKLDALHGWTHPKHFGRGVSFSRQSGKWRAYATLDGKQRSAGLHDTQEAAAIAAASLRDALLDELAARG